MILSKQLTFLFLLIAIQIGVSGSDLVKRDSNESVKRSDATPDLDLEKRLFGGAEERNLEQEILEELRRLNSRKQREIFNDLEKQQERFNVPHKSLVLSESDNLSPINVEELKKIRKTIKTSNTSLPAIRNKRTLNFLLYAVARAMGYTLTPSNPDAEWIPRQQPAPTQTQPCTTPAPPCTPNPPCIPPPCTPPPCRSPPSAIPPTTPPCRGSGALRQRVTIPPNQIDANTISYPYRPARNIPLLNFSPLPGGVRVPYPSLLQPLGQQTQPCTPQQPSPPPCGMTPAPPPPCTTPKSSPPPCNPTSVPSASPCGTTPAPTAPPCTAPAPPPPPCKPAPDPSCTTTPAPQPPPCKTTPAPPPPCTTPAPQTPCSTPAPPPPPCSTPAPPPLPCGSPAPPSPPPSPPPSDPPKKGNIFSGHENHNKEDWHAYFFPDNEKNRKKDEDFEDTEEEHIEEEDEEAPRQLKQYEEEDERILENNEEEDESETSLSVVKKPVDQEVQKTHKRRLVSSKIQTSNGKDKRNEAKQAERENPEKIQKMKKPKRKKWIRIVKKQRRKTKTDTNPHNNFQIYTSDSQPEDSNAAPKFFGKRDSHSSADSYERDLSDFSEGDLSDYSDDSSSRSSEVVNQLDLKKITVNKANLNSPELLRGYEFNFNPYASEPEKERRKQLEKAVERYVEDYVQKQLGAELIKNTGIPKTTVFEFAPKNGPKIQTITTTVAKTSHNGNPMNLNPQIRSETQSRHKPPTGNAHILKKNIYEENSKKRGDYSYESFSTRS